MSDGNNQNVEGAGAGGAAGSQPGASQNNPPSIDGLADQLFSALDTRLASRIEELTKPYLTQMEGLRKVQGNLDRSQNDLKTQLAEINKLTKSGMSQEEAVEYLDRQKAESERWQKIDERFANLESLITGNGAGQQKQTVADVFTKFGLDLKHPLVAAELGKQFKNSDEMEASALRLFYRIQTSPSPNAAQQPALQGGAGNNNQRDISNINDSSTLYDLAAQDLAKG